MLNETEIEEFLRQFAERVRGVSGNDTRLQQLIRDGAHELQAKGMTDKAAPSKDMGAVEESANQVDRLPTPPQPKEDPGDVFDPQRDISPG